MAIETTSVPYLSSESHTHRTFKAARGTCLSCGTYTITILRPSEPHKQKRHRLCSPSVVLGIAPRTRRTFAVARTQRFKSNCDNQDPEFGSDSTRGYEGKAAFRDLLSSVTLSKTREDMYLSPTSCDAPREPQIAHVAHQNVLMIAEGLVVQKDEFAENSGHFAHGGRSCRI